MSVALEDAGADDDFAPLRPKCAYEWELTATARFVAFVLASVALAGRIIASQDLFGNSLGRKFHQSSSGGGVAASASPSVDSSPAPEHCHSKTIDSGSVTASSTPAVPDGYELVQATVHMRHLDRWMYQHNLIDNICWTGQADSTDPIMKEQCRYNLSSVWETFEFSSDPYAYPAKGECNAKQLTVQGTRHAELLGRAYGNMFPPEKRLALCQAGSNGIGLEAHEEQKNQLSLQHAYYGICAKMPDTNEFTAEAVLDQGIVERGRPFYLQLALCGSDFMKKYLNEASLDFVDNNKARLKDMTGELAIISGKKTPDKTTDFVPFLDNEIDCFFCHFCHGLHDYPSELDDAMKDINELETLSRTYMFDYVEANGEEGENGKYKRFVSTYFGYYFATVLQRMRLSLDPETNDSSPSLYVQVTTDQIVSTVLRILGAPRTVIRQRPLWGSQIIFQLLRLQATNTSKTEDTAPVFVRILYDGQLIRMQPFDAFANFVDIITPSVDDCPVFHDNFG